MSPRTFGAALVAVVSLLVAGCGDDDSGGEPDVTVRPDVNGRVEIVADALEWNVDEIQVGAGESFVIDHVSLDAESEIAHNIHVPSAPGGPKTELEAVEHQELALTIDEIGDYGFVCDLHPTMRGTIVVEVP